MCKNHCKKQCLIASRNSAADLPDLPDLPDPVEMEHPVQNRPWVPHAGGQDYGSLHKLPQTTSSVWGITLARDPTGFFRKFCKFQFFEFLDPASFFADLDIALLIPEV